MACLRKTRSAATPTDGPDFSPAPCLSLLPQTLWGLALPPYRHSPPGAALWWGEGVALPLAGAPGARTGQGGGKIHTGTGGTPEDDGDCVFLQPRTRLGPVGVLGFLAPTSVNKEILNGTHG